MAKDITEIFSNNLNKLMESRGGHTQPLYISSLSLEVCKRCAIDSLLNDLNN